MHNENFVPYFIVTVVAAAAAVVVVVAVSLVAISSDRIQLTRCVPGFTNRE
jgi:hypothetical protein